MWFAEFKPGDCVKVILRDNSEIRYAVQDVIGHKLFLKKSNGRIKTVFALDFIENQKKAGNQLVVNGLYAAM